MALSASVVKAQVLAAMTTKPELQQQIWNDLMVLGFKEHGIPTLNPDTGLPYPNLHDCCNTIAERHWDLIKLTADSVVEFLIAHIIAAAIVTSVGPNPEGGVVNSLGKVT